MFLIHAKRNLGSNLQPKLIRLASSSLTNPYEVLGLSFNASRIDIKKRYRELSKKYHPDLNSSLSDLEKKRNSESFIRITKSYEILSDLSKKKEFDSQNSAYINKEQELKRQEFHTKYYGSSSSSKSSGLKSSRNRVHYAGGRKQTPPNYKSIFTGEFRDYAVNDVPHFDYEKHLRKNINVDKRYFENHSFNKSDYMGHFVRSGQHSATGGAATTVKNSRFKDVNTDASLSNSYSSMRSSTLNGGKNYHQDIKIGSDNKIPILVTSALGLVLLMVFTKSDNEPELKNDEEVEGKLKRQVRELPKKSNSQTYSYCDSVRSKKKLPFSECIK